MKRTIALTLALVSVLAGAAARAANYYVAPGGSDAGPGSSSQPWATLQHAADVAHAGDTVFIRTGTYAGWVSASSGTSGAPITFQASGGTAVVINAPGPNNNHGSCIEIENHDWWVVAGLEVTGATQAGVDIREASHVTVRSCHCHHNGKWGIFTGFVEYFTAENNVCDHSQQEHGIYHSNSGDHALIRGNLCYGNAGCGIQINADPSMGGDGISSDCEVSNNYLYGNGSAGGAAINLASVRDSLVANNLIYGNLAGGIAMWDDGQGNQWGCRNNRILFNTVTMPSTARWALNMIDGSTGNTVRNNVLLHDGNRGGIETDSSSLAGLQSDYNVLHRVSLDDTFLTLAQWQAQQGQDGHSADGTAAATFLSPGSDFHLLPTAWARNNGHCETDVDDDLDGLPRPQESACDAGCYEYATEAPLLGDIDENGVVNGADVHLLAGWLAANPPAGIVTLAKADINGDGRIDAEDLSRLAMMVE